MQNKANLQDIFLLRVRRDRLPVTMFLMFAALIVLYELSLLIARVVLGSRIKKQKEEAALEAAEDAEWQEQWQKTKASLFDD